MVSDEWVRRTLFQFEMVEKLVHVRRWSDRRSDIGCDSLPIDPRCLVCIDPVSVWNHEFGAIQDAEV